MSLLFLPTVLILGLMSREATLPVHCVGTLGGRAVPVDFVGERLFARWQLTRGGILRFNLDTGGGANMLYGGAAQRFGFVLDTSITGSDTTTTVKIPRSLGTPLFPSIPADDSTMLTLFVPPLSPNSENEAGLRVDGFLGRLWFADRVWTLDYPGRQLRYHGTAPAGPKQAACWVALGFQVDSTGRRTTQFPRVTARIDGDSLDFLFDTGAMTTLTDSAWAAIAPREPQDRATSFITHERFEQWHARHTDWLVVTNAEKGTGANMIRVPEVDVGGERIGPVWFTERPDQAFHQFMSQWMDRRVDGALGGSAWRYLTVILDYPRARAAFLRAGTK